jgi:hypothetical protein
MHKNEIPHDPRHLGVPSGACKMIYDVLLCLEKNHAPILLQDYHYLRMNWIELPLEPHHLVVLSGASKMISEPAVSLAQAMHLSCTNTNTIYKWTKTRFHMTHVTLDFHRVRQK